MPDEYSFFSLPKSSASNFDNQQKQAGVTETQQLYNAGILRGTPKVALTKAQKTVIAKETARQTVTLKGSFIAPNGYIRNSTISELETGLRYALESQDWKIGLVQVEKIDSSGLYGFTVEGNVLKKYALSTVQSKAYSDINKFWGNKGITSVRLTVTLGKAAQVKMKKPTTDTNTNTDKTDNNVTPPPSEQPKSNSNIIMLVALGAVVLVVLKK